MKASSLVRTLTGAVAPAMFGASAGVFLHESCRYPSAGPTSISATATTFVVTVRRSKADPTRGACRCAASGSAAARPRSAACTPRSHRNRGDAVVGLGVDQINRRFAAACAAAGLEGRRTSHGGPRRPRRRQPLRRVVGDLLVAIHARPRQRIAVGPERARGRDESSRRCARSPSPSRPGSCGVVRSCTTRRTRWCSRPPSTARPTPW